MTQKQLMSATASLAVCCATATAQNIDYASFEELFGEPVTTSAAGKPQRASEAPASMVIISGDELRRSGVISIPDILQNYAGMDVNRYTTFQREVTVRGANLPYNPRLLVLVDGRQVFLDHYGYTDWQLIGVEFAEIQQIEVVRGPNSALFGFNAVAGVVNIVTTNPIGKNDLSVRLEGGTEETEFASLVGSIALGEKAGLRVSGGYQSGAEWDSLPTSDTSDEGERYNFGTEFRAQLSEKVHLAASYNYAKTESLQQGFSYIVLPTENELQGARAVVSAETGFGLLTAQLYANTFEQSYTNTATGDLLFGNDLFSFKVDDVFQVGKHHAFRIGGEARRSEFEVNGGQFGNAVYNVLSSNAMWEWAVTPKLTFTNAGRADALDLDRDESVAPVTLFESEDYDVKETTFSYNSTVAFAWNDLTRLRASVARGAQLPSLNTVGLEVPLVFGAVATGDPTLEPSSTQSYEIAFSRQIPTLNGAFDLTAAFTDVSDAIASTQSAERILDPISGIPFLKERELGDFQTLSVEAALRGEAAEVLGWEVNYTFTDVSEDLVTPQVEFAIPLDEGTPEHKVNAIFDLVYGPFETYLVGRYRSETAQAQAGGSFNTPVFRELDAAVTADVRIGYRLENGAALWVSAENLTNDPGDGLSAFKAERRFRIGLGFNY